MIDCGGKPFIFVDGGVTMYNNPAFQMFLMATVDRYWSRAPADSRGWKTGVDDMLIVSVGTGTSAGENYSLRPDEMNLLFNATTISSALMYAALNEQDFLCRVFGDCVSGPLLDREVDDMIGSRGPLDSKLFRYARYNAELTRGSGGSGLRRHRADERAETGFDRCARQLAKDREGRRDAKGQGGALQP